MLMNTSWIVPSSETQICAAREAQGVPSSKYSQSRWFAANSVAALDSTHH